VAARHEAVGKQVDGKALISIEPAAGTRRTPCGPSETHIAGTPRRSIGVVVHAVAPVHKAAFSSRVICLTIESIEVISWLSSLD
jgi:hypothetical protein